MTESTHDLIAAKAARLRDLMRLADAGDESATTSASGTANRSAEDKTYWPTWTGGGWQS